MGIKAEDYKLMAKGVEIVVAAKMADPYVESVTKLKLKSRSVLTISLTAIGHQFAFDPKQRELIQKQNERVNVLLAYGYRSPSK